MRKFEFRDGKSNKFWEVSTDGATLTVRFGRIGTSGQTKAKTLESPAAAAAEMESLIREKTDKGYVETTGGRSVGTIPPGMETLHQSLREIKKWMRDNGASAIVEDLHPPAKESEIEAVEKEFGYRLPPELRELYRLHDGQSASMDTGNHFFRHGVGPFAPLRVSLAFTWDHMGWFIGPWCDAASSEAERKAWNRKNLRVSPAQKINPSWFDVWDGGKRRPILLPEECSTAWFMFAFDDLFGGFVHLVTGRVFSWAKEEGISLEAESFGAFLAGFSSELRQGRYKYLDEEASDYGRPGLEQVF